jgi:hypothetical protein
MDGIGQVVEDASKERYVERIQIERREFVQIERPKLKTLVRFPSVMSNEMSLPNPVLTDVYAETPAGSEIARRE